MSVSVCLSARISQKPHFQLRQIFYAVACGRDSVLLWQHAAIRYVLPVLHLCFLFSYNRSRRRDGIEAYCGSLAALLYTDNTPAAWYWLRPVLDDSGRQD